MRSNTPSSGDRALLAELRRRGCDASLTQIERWRLWRKTGLIPHPIKHGRGRGSYSEYANLDDAADRAHEVHQLLSRYHRLDEIALVLTMRGRSLDPANVKQAMLNVLGASGRSFASHQPLSDEPVAIAHNAVRALKHPGARQISADPNNTATLSTGALTVGAQMLAGADVAMHQLEQFVDAGGIAEFAASHGLSPSDVAAEVEPAVPYSSYTAMAVTADAATPSAIVEALQTASREADLYFPQHLFATAKDRDVAVLGYAVSLLTKQRIEAR